MVCAIGIFLWSMFSSRREGSHVTASESVRPGGGLVSGGYQALARFNPPAYQPAGNSKRPPQFTTAIERYSQRDFAAAIPGLAAAVQAQPDFVEARFYLGVCYLFTEDRAGGIAQLRGVVAAGETPFLERARFYLAKGLLASGDIPAAREQLDNAIAMHGDMEQQAESLLAQIK